MKLTFEKFWDSVELIRVLVARPKTWAENFTNTLAGMLKPRERLALPGVADKVIWLGGDATMDICGTVQWDTKEYCRFEVQPYLARLAAIADTEEPEIIIAIAELACLVVFAAAKCQSGAWHQRLVLYVGDNQNVRSWTRRRTARNRMARHLLRILRYIELKGKFVILATWLRTYHNATLDWISRDEQQVVQLLMQGEGFVEVSVAQTWAEILEAGYERRVQALALVDMEDWKLASQLGDRTGTC